MELLQVNVDPEIVFAAPKLPLQSLKIEGQSFPSAPHPVNGPSYNANRSGPSCIESYLDSAPPLPACGGYIEHPPTPTMSNSINWDPLLNPQNGMPPLMSSYYCMNPQHLNSPYDAFYGTFPVPPSPHFPAPVMVNSTGGGPIPANFSNGVALTEEIEEPPAPPQNTNVLW